MSRIKQITLDNVTTNTYTYNGLDTRVTKVDSTGSKTFKRMGAGVTAPVLSDGSATYTPGVSERRGSTTSYFMTERLGTHKAQTNTSQAVTATRSFDSFGNLVSSSGSSSSPFGFAGDYGYQEDPDYGLKLLGHRYYDSSTGRFLTRDPIKDGRNWYTYCGNNPHRWVDPSGLGWHNPVKVIVSPYFGGEVYIIGEPDESFGEDQYVIQLPPGFGSDPRMDVDQISINHPGPGGPERLFLPGDYNIDKGVPGGIYYVTGAGKVVTTSHFAAWNIYDERYERWQEEWIGRIVDSKIRTILFGFPELRKPSSLWAF